MDGKPKKRYISEVLAPGNNKAAMIAAALPHASQTTPSGKSHQKRERQKEAETPEKSTSTLTRTESGHAGQTQLSPSQITPSGKSHKKKKQEEAETPEKSAPSLTQAESGRAGRTQLSPCASPSSKRRNNSPGVRLVGQRIYDSDRGKTCHQCRQKTVDFAVSCENQRNNKQCTVHFCYICLLNRYGEEAEEMAALGGWKCPKCRGICNCSFCMKKQGCCPTGRLVHVAKAAGFSSVSEMLLLTKSKEAGQDASPSLEKEVVPMEEDEVALTRESMQENGIEDKSCLQSKHETCDDVHEGYGNPHTKMLRENDDCDGETNKIRKEGGASLKMLTSSTMLELAVASGRRKRQKNSDGESYLKLPQGIELSNVAQIDLPAEDIGHALQFLEFCAAFATVLDIEEGQSECLLRELACGRGSLRSTESSITQFHVKLLSMIHKNTGKEYSSLKTQSRMPWLQVLYRCISESQFRSRELLLDCLNLAAEGDGELSSSKKLRLLNFLCDEALATEELRSCFDEENLELKREKVRNMKTKLQDELARDMLMKNGVPHSASEHRNLVLKIKAEAAQNFVETLEAKDVVTKSIQIPNAIRSEAMFLDRNGRKFWKLRGYSGGGEILIQDIGNGDSVTLKDRWFSCSFNERETIERYYLRQLRK